MIVKRESDAVSEKQIDLLGRQEFIDRLITVAETLAGNRKSACFAINGGWGVGKTFVLEAFERQIRGLQAREGDFPKYLVFHYNCWQYECYQEPLVAMLAALLDEFETQPIASAEKEEIAAALKAAGRSIQSKVQRTGGTETGEFDAVFDFKKTLERVRDAMAALAEKQTILLVVDELDRCLPEYGIRTLERLRLFKGLANIQIILSLDRQQLSNTVKAIYGEKSSARRYLSKFIDFELKLDEGMVSDIVRDAYPEYAGLFTYDVTLPQKAAEVYTTLLQGIEIRTCREVVEKSSLCHKLLNRDGAKCDASVLCVELFLTLLKKYGLKLETGKERFCIENLFAWDEADPEGTGLFVSSQVLPGLMALSEQYRQPRGGMHYYELSDGEAFLHIWDVWGLLLGCYREVLGFEADHWENNKYDTLTVGNMNVRKYARKYWDFLDVVN